MPVLIRGYEHGGAVQLIEHALGDGREEQSTSTKSLDCVVVGDHISTEEQEGFLRGHGTHVVDGRLVSTLCGVVEHVDKLVYVRPLKSRYNAEQGDVVIGRVTEVAGKRWKIDLKSRQEAGLLLSAVNLPGGIQRRRNAEDELNMRVLFREGDLVSAEVQQVMSDGSVALHTRSNKYGKLAGGQLLTVPANLVKRQKQHFVSMQTIGVDIILGCNGLIWVAPSTPTASSSSSDQLTPEDEVLAYRRALEDGQRTAPQISDKARQLLAEGWQPPPPDRAAEAAEALAAAQVAAALGAVTRQQIEATTRVANAIRALAALYLSIYPATIMDAYEIAVEHEVALKDMLETEFLTMVVRSEAVRRHNA